MNLDMKSVFVTVALLFLSCAVVAEESEVRSYPLPNHGTFNLTIPKSWQGRVSQPPDNLPPTIVFAPPGPPTYQVLITPIWPAKPGIILPDHAGVRKNVERAAEKAKSQSVEKEIPIKEITGLSVAGYYYAITDKSPKPDEYKYMTQGMVRLGELMITFTALTNDGYTNAAAQTIKALQSATYTNGRTSKSGDSQAVRSDAIQVTQKDNSYILTVPVSRLVMSIPSSGLSQKDNSIGGSTDNPRYFYFDDSANSLIISGWFEPAKGFSGVQKFWTDETNAWKKNKLPEPRDVLFKKIGNWDAVLYDMDIPGKTNSHIRAHWIQSGTWIDMHLSVVSKQSSREARSKIESLLNSIVVTEKKN
jgi:hypothetical protein